MFKVLSVIGTTTLTGLVSAWYFFCGPGFDGTVASLKLADGSEYAVTQAWNGPVEPYQIRFMMKDPGGKWGGCYIDHQSSRWLNTKLVLDEKKNEVSITECGELMGRLDRTKKQFILRRGNQERSVPAPQWPNQKPPR